MIRLTALVCGLLCGCGLLLAGMTDPARLRGFLDVTGAWDPRFGLGLGAALVVAWLGVRMAAWRGAPVFSGSAEGAGPTGIDARLILGSLLFGAGMGMAGFVPGTALVAAGLFSADAAILLAAVLAGMVIHDVPARLRGRGPDGGPRLSRG